MKTTYRSILAVVALVIFNIAVVVQAEDYLYVTNNGTITITEYIGPGGDVTIPSTINGLPVTEIGSGWSPFYHCTSVTNITIPDTVSFIGGKSGPFLGCTNLMAINVAAINPVYSSVDGVLFNRSQTSLIQYPPARRGTSYTIPDGVIYIGPGAFSYCTELTKVIIPTAVDGLGSYAFGECSSLLEVHFEGNAPGCPDRESQTSSLPFRGTTNVTVYYLPGTIGWTNTYAERPTAPWVLSHPVILATPPNFGIQNNQVGFRISWATNRSVVVETSTTLANPVWSPLSTNTLVDGWAYFSDAYRTNYPVRFYRVRQW